MIRYIVIVLLAMGLAGCQSSSSESSAPDTSNSKKIGDGEDSGGLFSSIFRGKEPRAIMLPPDLVSSANETVRENHTAAEAQAARAMVLPEIAAASVVNDGERRWLRVETDAQVVWDTLTDFWAGEQIDLVEFKPAAGLMETDWVENNNLSEADEGRNIARFFNRITGQGVTFDKYKVRLERESEEVTLVYVTHRATARVEKQFNSPQKITEWEWVEKESDEEKVAQLLQVMVLLFENTA